MRMYLKASDSTFKKNLHVMNCVVGIDTVEEDMKTFVNLFIYSHRDMEEVEVGKCKYAIFISYPCFHRHMGIAEEKIEFDYKEDDLKSDYTEYCELMLNKYLYGASQAIVDLRGLDVDLIVDKVIIPLNLSLPEDNYLVKLNRYWYSQPGYKRKLIDEWMVRLMLITPHTPIGYVVQSHGSRYRHGYPDIFLDKNSVL